MLEKSHQSQIEKESGSFKDPSGGIFYRDGNVYRWVSEMRAQFYLNLVESEFFNTLVEKNMVVSAKPTEFDDDREIVEAYGGKACFFQHEPLDFISFPYEWSVAMVMDAAIHTLELQETLLTRNFSLKDATPYNIQFRNTNPVFIDLCSLEQANNAGIWIAYNQFLQNFLYPLLMATSGASDHKGIFLSCMDGVTIEETVRSIGYMPAIRNWIILDYLIPALLTKKKKNRLAFLGDQEVGFKTNRENSNDIQRLTVNRLRKVVRKLDPKPATSQWKSYTKNCSYLDEDYAMKKDFIRNVIDEYQPSKVLDIGCNTGDFSILAARKNCKVVAIDSEHECINNLYQSAKENKCTILPLWIDIANPSPAIGWLNSERESFLNRYKKQFDCVFALALIHHLIIYNRITLTNIAGMLNQLTNGLLAIEYVGTGDIMFRQLLKFRSENYDYISVESFERAMSTHFTIGIKNEMKNNAQEMDRCLYLLQSRD